ncbi:MAG: hypothetical protein K9I59_10865 [Chlorobium sp.]|uniref:hypothetical protein n=1 Tax=Chlorobium sp. TaxID=1095 RepID=UPI0025C21553|nr:hypothetical protein [Chlorobium sp.]MCF8217308.1 hypothetical protein [Chlorobium sp.]MCF8272156.1 hypothetical protein [Chlorobium sp.]MCF8288533.1 hypothetical protein [Chlorobium sp.]MCF8292115.1 hypothetical protein [Chlorobium sp.]
MSKNLHLQAGEKTTNALLVPEILRYIKKYFKRFLKQKIVPVGFSGLFDRPPYPGSSFPPEPPHTGTIEYLSPNPAITGIRRDRKQTEAPHENLRIR